MPSRAAKLTLMPWILGNERDCRLMEMPAEQSLRLADWLEDSETSYLGYLLDGFEDDLKRRWDPHRAPWGFRAGWPALAVAVRTQDVQLGRRFGPFLAPTAPRPHASVPLGLTLFSSRWLRLRWESGALEERRSGADWAVRLNRLIGPAQPVFCDPVLELTLTGSQLWELEACSYRPPARGLRRYADVLRALWHANWHSEEARCG
jgi:hypothetical protein